MWAAREGGERSDPMLCGDLALNRFHCNLPCRMRRICWAYGLSRWLNVHLPRLQMEFFRFFSVPSPPSLHSPLPMFIQVSSNILRSRCLSFRCGVTVERQNEGRGRMYGKWVTRAESSALLLASSCLALVLLLDIVCHTLVLFLPFI